jgi:cation transport regulator ChaB
MPYASGDIPGGTERVPKHGQAIYRAAFNSAHAGGASEESAHAIAWSAVKNKYKKKGERWVAKAAANDWSGVMRTIAHGLDKEFSTERRQELAKSGKAMPGGGFPIENEADLKNAIRAFGRAKNKAAAKAHIKKRASSLGLTKLIPENWDALPAWLAPASAARVRDAWEETDAKRIPPEDEEDEEIDPDEIGESALDRRYKENGDDDGDDDDDDETWDTIDQRSGTETVQMHDQFVIDGVRKTRDGYLVANARIARTGIQLYDSAELGLPGVGVVRVYRPPEEVFNKRALHSLAHRPITLNHPPLMVDAANWKQYAVGQTGDEVVRDGDHVRVPMVIMDAKAIEQYEKHGVAELSVGYSTDLKWGKGRTPAGEIYDAKQTQIRGNHLAVVPAARGGSSLRIGDDRGASDMPIQLVIDGQIIQFESEAAGNRVQGYIAQLQKQLADAMKKNGNGKKKNGNGNGNGNGDDDAAEEEQEEEKKTRGERDALKGEVAVLKKQLDEANAKLTGDALDKIVQERTELRVKADAALDGKADLNGKEPMEIRRMVVQAKLGDAAKTMTDGELIGAFKAITANLKPRTGSDRLADNLAMLSFGGGDTQTPKAIKDAAYEEMMNRQRDAWKVKASA